MPPRQPLVIGAVAHADTALGGQHERIALALEPAAEDFLAAPRRFHARGNRIHVGAIEEADAEWVSPLPKSEP